jgi:hypothetical protein
MSTVVGDQVVLPVHVGHRVALEVGGAVVEVEAVALLDEADHRGGGPGRRRQAAQVVAPVGDGQVARRRQAVAGQEELGEDGEVRTGSPGRGDLLAGALDVGVEVAEVAGELGQG